jgi:hypothetical protein
MFLDNPKWNYSKTTFGFYDSSFIKLSFTTMPINRQ